MAPDVGIFALTSAGTGVNYRVDTVVLPTNTVCLRHVQLLIESLNGPAGRDIDGTARSVAGRADKKTRIGKEYPALGVGICTGRGLHAGCTQSRCWRRFGTTVGARHMASDKTGPDRGESSPAGPVPIPCALMPSGVISALWLRAGGDGGGGGVSQSASGGRRGVREVTSRRSEAPPSAAGPMAPSSGARPRRPRPAPRLLRPRPAPWLISQLLLLAAVCRLGTAAAADDEWTLQFTQSFYNASIYENNVGKEYVISDEPMGLRVPEDQLGREIRFKIIDGDPDSFFKVQQQVVGDFCFLRVRTRTNGGDVLNRERQSHFRLKVRAAARGWRRPGGRQPAYTEVLVRVLDRNDLSPWFDQVSYDVEVPEDLPVHGLVTKLHADDADAGINGMVYYSLKEDEPQFAMEPSTGRLTLARRLNHRQRPDFQLTAVARDRGRKDGPGVPGEAPLRIRVRPVNLFDPVMRVTHLSEVRRFRVLPGSAVGEWLVGVSEPLDRESAPHGFNLTLNATDAGTPPRSSGLSVRVRVTDFNDHAPAFTHEAYDVTVPESALAHTPLVRLRASDSDSGLNAQVRYAIAAGNEGGEFSINSDTGLLSLARPLDAETKAFYALTDRDNRHQFDCETVNDNRPQFEKVDCHGRLWRRAAVGTEIMVLSAIDFDDGAARKLGVMANDGQHFSDETQLRLQLVGDGAPHGASVRLECKDTGVAGRYRELLATAERNNRAEDPYTDVPSSRYGTNYHRPQLSARPDGELHVSEDARLGHRRDVNDNPPRFSRSVYRVRASEDLPVGAVVAQLEARDPDSPEAEEPVQYRVVTGGHGRFGVDRRSGAVRLLEPLDFERRQSYNVVDVNENYFAPSFRGAVAVSGSVREGLPPGTFVLAVRATDADPDGPNSEVTYSIRGGNGLGHFTINQTGIYTRDVLDRESRSSYWLTVYAKDGGAVPLSARIEVYIEVDDVNDNCPLTSEPVYHAEVLENSPAGTPVARVTATDRDGDGPLTYSIAAGNPQSLFSINSKTVELQDSQPISAEQVRSGGVHHQGRQLQMLTVVAYDGAELTLYRNSLTGIRPQVAVADWGVPQALTSTARVKVTVLDENDSPPVFPERLYRVQVQLGPALRRPNATIFQVTAEDADAGVNAELRYSVVATDGVRMDIEPRLGQLRLPPDSAGQLTAGKHALTVKATDGGSPAKSSVTRVLLDVLPEQPAAPYPPRVMLPSETVQVFETEPVGHLVQFAAANTTVLFSIVGGNTGGSFSVNSPGGIVIARPLDWETTPEYTLNISATDGHHVIYTPLHISVMDLNDREPTLSQRLYSVNVSEAAEPGRRLVSVAAHDPDGEATLYYGLEAAQSERSLQLFAIDSLSGRVTVAERLDRETEHEHVLTVSVRDQGTPARRDYARLVIHVTDENDHGPTFLSDLVVGQVPETAAEGTQVVTVLATDRDHGENARVTYSIQSGKKGEGKGERVGREGR
ncbi:Protocadherin Fat 3 [Amphibalanus amphitrite]|uniref:Protocadherin Fat 3 n=1 Tax=Amphibalanus amphitrite TaxID=1232801 RepID=A0A6A4W6E8_AMPAM|nr:Protocadherin Fat 3 [Amphibalanus amphitrite]